MQPSIIYWTAFQEKNNIELLASLSSNLLVFSDLKEGFNELKLNHYDIILLSGFELEGLVEFIEKIKKRHKNIPIIVHRTSYQDRSQLLKLGVTDCVIDDLFVAPMLHHVFLNALQIADLSRQKRESVVQLKKLENRLNTIMKNTPVILFMLDLRGVFMMGLGTLWDQFKVNKQFVIGQQIKEVYNEYPAFVSAFDDVQKGEVQNISININNIIFEIILTPVFDNKGEVKEILGLAHDVTERARSEMSLLKAKKIAEDAAKIKQEFIANMSHEIRTPMNAIVGFINLLEETSLDPVQTDYVQSVKISGENLLSLINSILDFSKIESGEVSQEEEVFDLNHVINSIDRVLLLKVQEKKLLFKQEIKESVPTELMGDANKLYQILTNLLANSVKFTENGEVLLSVDCVSIVDDTAILEFKVKDTGIGIPDYMLKKVFDSFTQVNTGSNRKYGGTGLGLSIVKKIVQQLKGSIHLKSELRKGTEFIVKIPFKILQNNENLNLPADKVSKDLTLPKGLRILLAEDNVMNQKLVLMILKKYPVVVDLAETGVEVIKALKANEYDVVLMDIQMPEMDGIEATKIIRKEFGEAKRNIPIIAMTAHAFQEELDKCIKVGMNAHVIKPIDTENFINTVNNCLHQKDNPAIIDFSYLEKIFDNDKAMIGEVIQTFEWEIPEILGELQEGIDGQNWEQASKMAHKAKASFKMFGMHECVTRLVQIEVDAKSQLYDNIQLNKDSVLSKFTSSIELLKANETYR